MVDLVWLLTLHFWGKTNKIDNIHKNSQQEIISQVKKETKMVTESTNKLLRVHLPSDTLLRFFLIQLTFENV